MDQIDDEIDDKISSSIINNDDTESMDNDDDNEYRQDLLEDEIDLTIRDEITEPFVGESIEVFWPMDNAFYPGIISSIEDGSLRSIMTMVTSIFLNMWEETWKYQSNDHNTVATANASTLELESNE